MTNLDNHNISINDTVYFCHPVSKICCKGTVIDIKHYTDTAVFYIDYTFYTDNTYIRSEFNTNISVFESDVFKTEKECLSYIKQQEKERAARYKEQIKSLDDLIDFCVTVIGWNEDHDRVTTDVILERYAELKNQQE